MVVTLLQLTACCSVTSAQGNTGTCMSLFHYEKLCFLSILQPESPTSFDHYNVGEESRVVVAVLKRREAE